MMASGDLFKTGFTGIDEIIGGFRPGSFNVIEGRLDSEKYIFLQDIIKNFLNQGYSVFYVSLGGDVNDPSVKKRLSQTLHSNRGSIIRTKEIKQDRGIYKEWENAIASDEVCLPSLTVVDDNAHYYGRLPDLITAITAWSSCHNGICIIDEPILLTLEEEVEWGRIGNNFVRENRLAKALSSTAKETGTCIIAINHSSGSFDEKVAMRSRFEYYWQYAREFNPWFYYCDIHILFLHLRTYYRNSYIWCCEDIVSKNWNYSNKARVIVVKNDSGSLGDTILDYRRENGISRFVQSDVEKFKTGLIIHWLYRSLMHPKAFQKGEVDDYELHWLMSSNVECSKSVGKCEKQFRGLSTPRYARTRRCCKALWMDEHIPELFDVSVIDEESSITTDVIVDLARRYFGNYVEVDYDERDISAAAQHTSELIADNATVICNATFIDNEGYSCMVDILRIVDGEIQVVKIETRNDLRTQIIDDVAYQLTIMKQCGISVNNVYTIHLNPDYERWGSLNIQELFLVEDITKHAQSRVKFSSHAFSHIEFNAAKYDIRDNLGSHCDYPDTCGYKRWCMRKLPKPSVYDLCNMTTFDASRLHQRAGLLTFQDLFYADYKLEPRQQVQIECEVKGIKEMADCNAITDFLSRLNAPLCFLDIKAERKAIPPFDG